MEPVEGKTDSFVQEQRTPQQQKITLWSLVQTA